MSNNNFTAKAALKEDGWVDEKPKEWKECILITANWWGGYWEYTTFSVEKVDGYNKEGEPAWYWGILQNGDEWGDIADLKADKYLILEPLPQPPTK